MSEMLFKIDFTLGYRNMTKKLYTVICGANNESEINIVRRINACKKIFLLALVLVHSTVVDTIFDISLTILVMVPVDTGFSRGLAPILHIRSTLALHLALVSNCQ